MIFSSIKIKLIVVGIAAYTSFLVWATWQISTAREAKKQNNIMQAAIKKSNKDAETLRIIRAEKRNEIRVVEEKIVYLPGPVIDNTKPCPSDDVVVGLIGLQRSINQAASRLPVR